MNKLSLIFSILSFKSLYFLNYCQHCTCSVDASESTDVPDIFKPDQPIAPSLLSAELKFPVNPEDIPKIKLNSGHDIPVIGFGTWQADGDKLVQAIKDGLKQGYRQIESAWFFHNEREIARALQESYLEGIVKREDVFIVYKIWPKNMNFKRTLNVIKNALIEMDAKYFDLISIQWPLKDNSEIYSALESALSEGLTRSIGVSNFKPQEIEDLMKTANIMPAINHIRIHPGFNQDQTVDYCLKKGIAVAGWSPLGTGSLVNDPILIQIGNKYSKSAAQVMIRWQIQRGLIVIPKSTKLNRIQENIDVFDFKLSEEDMKTIHSMTQTNIVDYWG